MTIVPAPLNVHQGISNLQNAPLDSWMTFVSHWMKNTKHTVICTWCINMLNKRNDILSKAYWVTMGAMRSTLPMMTPSSEKKAVMRRARTGSPDLDVTEKTLMKGITPSEAMACSRRGAPTGGRKTHIIYTNLAATIRPGKLVEILKWYTPDHHMTLINGYLFI